MEKRFFKLEIRKDGGLWTCDLYELTDELGTDAWKFEEQVSATSYSDLQIEIGSAGFFEKLNENS